MIYFTKCENLLLFFARSGKIMEIILCTETHSCYHIFHLKTILVLRKTCLLSHSVTEHPTLSSQNLFCR